jgi:hypothetical protein
MAVDPIIHGHPAVEVFTRVGAPPTLITVCASCGQVKSILFLDNDRWFCTKCRTEGATAPNLYPVA